MPQDGLLMLPDAQRAAINAVLDSQRDRLTRARNMSRTEVFQRERAAAMEHGEIATVSPWRFCELIGLENGFKVTVNKRSQFEINDRRLGLKPLYYLAAIGNRHLRVGETFLAFVNPWSPRTALLCRDDGRAEGLVDQWDLPGCNDFDAIHKVKGKQAHWQAQRREAMEERHAVEAQEVAHMKEHNAAIIAGQTPEDAEEADRQLSARARVEEALARASETYETSQH